MTDERGTSEMNTPNHDRMQALRAGDAGQMLAWLASRGMVLTEVSPETGKLQPTERTDTSLLAEWGGVDLNQVAEELLNARYHTGLCDDEAA